MSIHYDSLMETFAIAANGDSAEQRKSRGAFFTPPELCSFVADWCVRDRTDKVLEPSCGEAAFLLAAGQRLRRVGAPHNTSNQLHGFRQLHGIELHDASAVAALNTMVEHDLPATINVGSFFDVDPRAKYDAVVGNPPYIRFQSFTGDDRRKSKERALAEGVALSGLASSWAAFVVHAARCLKPDGRLGLVLPAELLTVNYAAPVRRYLLERFAEVRLVMFEQRVFPGVTEEVVLLLATGSGGVDHFKVTQIRDHTDLQADHVQTQFAPGASGTKWSPALLPAAAGEAYAQAMRQGLLADLIEWGETSLGMVTGNNKYFTLTAKRAKELKLGASELLPISPPGSRHLRGLSFTDSAWQEMANDESRVYLFAPDLNRPSTAALRYIESGLDDGVANAYKCRVRKQWWQVPRLNAPDLFVTYMNHETPRLVANRANVRCLNSIHGVVLKSGLKQLGMDLLPLASLNSLTLLGAEIVGRSYGGGMLKMEPKEADVLPVPSAAFVESKADELRNLRPQLAVALRSGRLGEAVQLVDRVLLLGGVLTATQLKAVREAREHLFARRVARGSSKRGAD